MPEKVPLMFKNARIITPMRVIDKGILAVTDGKIFSLDPASKNRISSNDRLIDVAGNYLTPGFIDIHLNGGGGVDSMDATTEGIDQIIVTHARGDATSIVPTTTTAPMGDIIKIVEVTGAAKKRILPGAQVLGGNLLKFQIIFFRRN